MNKLQSIEEVERLKALASYNILDTPPDAVIDSMTQAAAAICGVPIALVSLVDINRQWFKSNVGLAVSETPREHSFCTHAIEDPSELMVVEDATKDIRFADNPLVVGDPNIQFYAGKPLVTADGQALGTLCVIDRKPRRLTQLQEDALLHLARAIVMLLEAPKQSLVTAVNSVTEKALQHGVIIADPNSPGNPVLYCNTFFETLTGYTSEELLGQSYPFFEGKDTDPAMLSELQNAVDQQQEAEVVLRNYRKDGSEFWNEVNISPIDDDQGMTTHVVGIHKDVSVRQIAQGAAHELGVVMDASDNEIYIIDRETLNYVYVNQGGLKNTGYSIEEFANMTPMDINPQVSRETYTELAKKLHEKDEKREFFSAQLIRKDGTKYPIDLIQQLGEYQQKPVFIGLAIDTTERRRTEAALAESLSFLESAPDPMIVYSDDGEIKMANRQSARFFGYPIEEFYKLHTDMLVEQPDLDEYKVARERFVAQQHLPGQSLEVEMLAKTRDGKIIPVDVTICPVIMDGIVLRSASVRDASVRLESERVLREAKELAEETTNTKSRFLAAASHDLRQPLQSIGMYLSILERQNQMPQEAVEVCQSATKSLGVMGRLLDTLLNISELDTGSITPTKRDVPILEIIDNIITDSQPHADKKNLLITLECEDLVVYTDPPLLERIIENFVSNAIRYTEQGYVSIKCHRQDNQLTIAVTDSGSGIALDQQENIFEEYYQLDNDVRDRKKGLGLGLSIVKHIARLLDYPLEVSSPPGSGATFSVVVPLGSKKSPYTVRPKAIVEKQVTGQKQIVLLVDDDEAVLISTSRLLRVFDMEVHTALSGDEALVKITDGLKPDFLVSDFRLPHYDGIEVISRIRDALGWEIPAIIMSGDTESARIKETKLPSFKALNKPVDPEVLRSLIEGKLSEL